MRILIYAVAGLAIGVSSASAQSPPAPQSKPGFVTTPSAEIPDAPPPTAPQPLDLDELSTLNGRQGTTAIAMSDQDLTAVNRGNTITANSVGSGQITIDRGAFEGFAGVGNFVINSGHNNNLQGALTINIVSP